MTSEIRVLLFATAREAAGRRSVEVSVPEEGASVAALLATLAHDHPGLGRVVRTSRVVLNGQFVDPTVARARPGDELAIHPPYSGG